MRITLFQPGKNKNPPKTKTKPKEGLTTGRRSPPPHPPPTCRRRVGARCSGGLNADPGPPPPPARHGRPGRAAGLGLQLPAGLGGGGGGGRAGPVASLLRPPRPVPSPEKPKPGVSSRAGGVPCCFPPPFPSLPRHPFGFPSPPFPFSFFPVPLSPFPFPAPHLSAAPMSLPAGV